MACCELCDRELDEPDGEILHMCQVCGKGICRECIGGTEDGESWCRECDRK